MRTKGNEGKDKLIDYLAKKVEKLFEKFGEVRLRGMYVDSNPFSDNKMTDIPIAKNFNENGLRLMIQSTLRNGNYDFHAEFLPDLNEKFRS